MVYTVSVVNHKGGVGKTTCAVNIAASLGETGWKVLLVDFDPQGSASLFLGVEDDGARLLNALQKTTDLPIVREAAKGVDLVPSGPKLVEARQRFTLSLGRELLRRCLQRTHDDVDWILIDCPPSIGVLTLSALFASHRVIIPVEASYLALNGLKQFVSLLRPFEHEHGDVDIVGLIPCRAQPRRRIHGQILLELEQRFPGRVAPAVRENVSLAEAPGRGKPVTVSAPRSHGAEDYAAVTRWLLERLQTTAPAPSPLTVSAGWR